MSDLLKTKAVAWPARPLGELFRINGDQIVPMASPNAEFVHYSIPAWDATGGAATELGSQIESNKTAITSPSVLVSKLNPRKPRVVAVPTPMERTCCSTEFICYQPKQPNEDLNFWADYFASADFSARLARVAVGSTNSHTRAAPKETLKWFVPEVPSAQQQKIAQIFDAIDIAILETEAITAKLKAVKQGLLHDLLTRGIDANGELRPPQAEAAHFYKMSPLGWIPKEWYALTLGDVCSLIRDGTHLPPIRVADGPLLLSVRNMQNGLFILTDQDTRVSEGFYRQMHKNWEVQKGDVLLAIVGATIGKTAIVGDMPKFTLQRSVAVLRGKPDKLLNPFLHLYVGSPEFQLSLWAQVNQTAQPGIYLDQLGGIEIPVPSPSEQEAIQLRLQALQRRIDDESDAALKLKKQKAGLMEDLLTGRVRVTPLLTEAAQQPGGA